ncbi:uncharacterized protein C5orf49 homolog isoform X1 [Chelonia mydas]|uniref:uncharacterized protein C5orf49 homolog isoform X1 n=1 Tax=Chelonia mydas TaxID=8469 RepID=UPI001CA8E80E|nr:uncharacterized protein C5orf49 homolog isoform X1 [Chelonia mydas]
MGGNFPHPASALQGRTYLPLEIPFGANTPTACYVAPGASHFPLPLCDLTIGYAVCFLVTTGRRNTSNSWASLLCAPGGPGSGRGMPRTQEATEPDGQREEKAAEQASGKHQLPLCALSAFSYIPPGRRDPPEHSYFHQEFKGLFPHMTPFLRGQWVTMKNSTDVTENMQTIEVLTLMMRNQWLSPLQSPGKASCLLRELARPIAVLSSSEYGRHINQPVEQSIRDYARINRVQAEFYRKNGVTCLLEKPSQSLEPS